MKGILLVSEFFPPDPGGIQRSLELLSPAWGDDVIVISPVAQKMYPGLRRSIFSGRIRPRWAWLIGEFWRRARGGRRIVVFGHYSAAVMAAWLLYPWGVRYIILAHGHDVLSEVSRPTKPWVARHFRTALWVGVNSQWLRRKIETFGVSRQRIIVTHPAVDDREIVTPSSSRCDGMVVTIARLVPRKNISTVLRAIALLVSTMPKIQYHIIGDGPERSQLEALADELHITDHVVWHGRTTDQDRRALLQRAKVFVLAPIIREQGADIEGLGAVFLEAAAAGVPIVASDTGGVSDAVHHQKNGLLLSAPQDPMMIAEAIRSLLVDSELCQRYGLAGQALMREEFTASRRAERVSLLLRPWPIATQPLISVIIPAYQAARTIPATLTSVWAQTWKNIEVIVVDDGSTDDLEKALAPWRDRVTYIHQINSGAPVARNRGAADATGQWWLFLDADTVLHPELLMRMATVLQVHPDAAYAYCDFRFGIKNFRLHDFSPERLREMNYIHTTSLLRPAAFPGFDPSLKRFQDWDVWLTMLRHGQVGIWLPERLFTVQDGGIMSRWLPSFVYRLPLIGRGRGSVTIKKYREAEKAIREKHQLK